MKYFCTEEDADGATATALQRGLTLATTDSDFERVPGLDYMLISLRG